MLKRIHRITNVCRVRLLDVLSPVTISKLLCCWIYLTGIFMPKWVLISFADTCTLEIEQLGPFPAVVCQQHTAPLGERTENAFHFQYVSQRIFCFYCDIEMKIRTWCVTNYRENLFLDFHVLCWILHLGKHVCC